MTELYIDGKQAALPENFSVAVKVENPFFTKNGEYTYEIKLSLKDGTNAELYGFVNRLNSTDGVRSGRKAVLVADGHVYCDGTEVITGWTDEEVSVQLVSGNSELNYFIGADALVSSYTSMPVTSWTAEQARSANLTSYPSSEAVAPILCNSSDGSVINAWAYRDGEWILDGACMPQPYLAAYVRHLLRAMGYELTYNAVEDTPWKDVIMLQGTGSQRWCDWAPGWTAKELLEGYEKLFNGTFVIDYLTKKARFVLNQDYVREFPQVFVQDVTDSYNVECGEEPQEDACLSNVRYAVPSTDYYKLHACDNNVLERAFHGIATDPDMNAFFRSVWSFPKWLYEYYGRYAIKVHVPLEDSEGSVYGGMFVGEFSALLRDRSSDDFHEIPLVPAEMREVEYDAGINVFSHYEIPAVEGSAQESSEDVSNWLYDRMRQEQSSGDKGRRNIYIAIYAGMERRMWMYGAPVAHTDSWMREGGNEFVCMATTATLRLKDMGPYFFTKAYEVDVKSPIEVHSYDPSVYDVRCIFAFGHRRYLCKEMEYTIGPQGRSGSWKGVFYPVRLSDTDTEKRWILNDGTWRDTGVYIEDGRWNDKG